MVRRELSPPQLDLVYKWAGVTKAIPEGVKAA
jgi:hypothetical protein